MHSPRLELEILSEIAQRRVEITSPCSEHPTLVPCRSIPGIRGKRFGEQPLDVFTLAIAEVLHRRRIQLVRSRTFRRRLRLEGLEDHLEILSRRVDDHDGRSVDRRPRP